MAGKARWDEEEEEEENRQTYKHTHRRRQGEENNKKERDGKKRWRDAQREGKGEITDLEPIAKVAQVPRHLDPQVLHEALAEAPPQGDVILVTDWRGTGLQSIVEKKGVRFGFFLRGSRTWDWSEDCSGHACVCMCVVSYTRPDCARNAGLTAVEPITIPYNRNVAVPAGAPFVAIIPQQCIPGDPSP